MSDFDFHRVVNSGLGEFPGPDALHNLASDTAGEVKPPTSVAFVSRALDSNLALGRVVRDAATIIIRI